MRHILHHMGSGYRCTRCGETFDQSDPGRSDECPAAVAAVHSEYESGTVAATSGYMQVHTPASPIRSPHSLGAAPKVIGFAGQKGSGKDTAADVFVAHGYTKVRMADGLKAMLRALLDYRGVSAELTERYIEGDLKEVPCQALGGQTMRHAMQHLGTAFGRNLIHQNLWVDATRDKIDALLTSGHKVVCADIRFPNEVAAIKFLGGKVYHVYRIGHVSDDTHVSEQLVNDLQVDEYITNGYRSAEAFQAHVQKTFKLSI